MLSIIHSTFKFEAFKPPKPQSLKLSNVAFGSGQLFGSSEKCCFSFFVACLCKAQYLVFVADEKGAGFHFVAFRLRIIHPAPQAAIIILIDPPLLEAGHFVPMFRLNRVL